MSFKELMQKIFPLPAKSSKKHFKKLEVSLNDITEADKKAYVALDEFKNKYSNDIDEITDDIETISKNILKTESDIQRFSNSLKEIYEEASKGASVSEENSQELKEISKSIADRFGKLYYHINQIESNMICDTYYVHKFEKNIIMKAFGDVKKDEDFEKKFLKLIKNLDKESVDTLITIFNRIEKIYWAPENVHLDLYTQEEKKKLRELKENFTDKIMKISSGLYYYDGFYLPANQFEDSVFYYKHGIDSLKTLDKIRGKNIIDAGGYIGDSILILSPLTDKKVYSFEAVSQSYELMQKTIELNNIKNAVPVKKALGEKDETMEIIIAGSSSTVENRYGMDDKKREKVECITLDEFVDEHKLDVGMIKVDIEGAEQSFLKGAKKTIREQKPTLLISIYHNLDDLMAIKPIIEEWNLGYKFRIYRPVIKKIVAETLLIAETE